MFLRNYKKFLVETRQCSTPLPLTENLVKDLIKEFDKSKTFSPQLMYFLEQRIVPGVHPTSYIKANFLNKVINNPDDYNFSAAKAASILGTMQGGYNIKPLVDCLDNDDKNVKNTAINGLSNTILMFDSFYDVVSKAEKGCDGAEEVLKSWSNKQWLLNKPPLKESIKLTSFVVNGEINTDDFSPAQDASTRDDIPFHATAMFKNSWDREAPLETVISKLKDRGNQIAFVGNIIGTGSSRKSAANSLLWHIGSEQNYIPNKKTGGFCFGEKIAPIFYNTLQDCGTFALENIDVREIEDGNDLVLMPYDGLLKNNITGEVLTFEVPDANYFEQIRAGGRINHIIGSNLSNKASEVLGVSSQTIMPKIEVDKSYTLAQKIIGKAAGLPGVLPGSSHMVNVSSVGSQDTTGPMTRSELQDLACLGFNASFVLQSFCHTAAYPKPVDIVNHKTLPEFINSRGGVSLKPGDGIIHSWLNRTLLPDTVGTGGDSHTRFPIGISFPAGSGLVAFAAATGSMPLEVPESILIKFKGKLRPGITLRDAVHYIPLKARELGLLTLDKKGKKNIFNGKIIEIEGLEHLYPEYAFEMSDATAERSAAGCVMNLSIESVSAYLKDNVNLLNKMIEDGYEDSRTIQRRIDEMEKWLENPVLMRADKNAQYSETILIDLDEIIEPVLCCPNDPDDARFLSDVAGAKIDEVFIGSCMTNINHFKEASIILGSTYNNNTKAKLWIAPPTAMDHEKLIKAGYYRNFEKFGANLETPGCSLCMGNQARVADKAHVVSTSTRNFPNRLGKGAQVYLASSHVAAVTAKLGYIPNYEKYMEFV